MAENHRRLEQQLDVQNQDPFTHNTFHTEFGENNWVTTEPVSTATGVPSMSGFPIDHPNVVSQQGSTSFGEGSRTHVFEHMNFTLDQLNLLFPLVQDDYYPKPIYINILRQTLQALDAEMKAQRAHRNLRPENVGIRIYGHPYAHQLTPQEWEVLNTHDNPNVAVKLFGHSTLPGTRAGYLEDLRAFGEKLLMPYLERCYEAKNILYKIDRQRHYHPTDPLLLNYQMDRLSAIQEENYLRSPLSLAYEPLFWIPPKPLNFCCITDEIIDRIYHKEYVIESVVHDFIEDLKLYEVRGWDNHINRRINEEARNFKKYKGGLSEEQTILGIIKCARNSKTHFYRIGGTARRQIGRAPPTATHANGAEFQCYEYFRDRAPKFLVHTFNCVKLHHKKLANLEGDRFRWDLKEYLGY